MPSDGNKEIKAIVKKLRAQNWRVELENGGHYKAFSPDGKTIVVFAGTIGKGRALANTIASLRRAGANLS